MRNESWRRAGISALGGALLLLGCPAADDGPPANGGEDDTEDDGDPGTTEAVEETTTLSGTSASSEPPDESSSTSDDPTTASASNFISDPDGNSVSVECSIWDQDCAPGEKCMPWANDGGNSWNATRCTPIAEDAGSAGDPCTVEGSGVSGVDDCVVGAMCWNVDPETNTGVCLAFCQGSANNPICDDPDTSCSITNEGVLALCLLNCDPLQQNCLSGEGCWQVDDSFVCAPDASGEGGGYGEPCEAINVCDPFLACFDASAVPGCVGSGGCCTEVCDLAEPNPSQNCAGFADGQMCIPAFEPGQAPPEYGDVGYCLLPA